MIGAIAVAVGHHQPVEDHHQSQAERAHRAQECSSYHGRSTLIPSALGVRRRIVPDPAISIDRPDEGDPVERGCSPTPIANEPLDMLDAEQ